MEIVVDTTTTESTERPLDILQHFIFNNVEHKVTIVWENGEPLFKASDIGNILGMTNIRATMQVFDDDEKGVGSIYTPGGLQNVLMLTEIGLYRLLFQSRMPIATPFRKWVANIIKDIQKKGRYETQELKIMLSAFHEKNETNVREAKHDALTAAFHHKHVIYFGRIGQLNGRTLVKLGSTNDIQNRSRDHRKNYGAFDLIVVIESQTNRDFELKLLKHRKIRRWLYRKPVKLDGGTSNEVILVNDDELKSVLHIAECKRKKYPPTVIRDGERRLTELQSDIYDIKNQMLKVIELVEGRVISHEAPPALELQSTISEGDELTLQTTNEQSTTSRNDDEIAHRISEQNTISQDDEIISEQSTISQGSDEIAPQTSIETPAIVATTKPRKRVKRVRTKGTGKCCDCESAISKAAVRCQACVDPGRRFEVTAEELNDLVHVKRLSYVFIGKHFGVSDNAVRKRCKTLGVKIRRPGDK